MLALLPYRAGPTSYAGLDEGIAEARIYRAELLRALDHPVNTGELDRM